MLVLHFPHEVRVRAGSAEQLEPEVCVLGVVVIMQPGQHEADVPGDRLGPARTDAGTALDDVGG